MLFFPFLIIFITFVRRLEVQQMDYNKIDFLFDRETITESLSPVILTLNSAAGS